MRIEHFLRSIALEGSASVNGHVLPILTHYNPLLGQESVEVTDYNDASLAQLVRDLVETMKHARGWGIAAPQVGVLQRVIIASAPTRKFPDAPHIFPTTAINPVILATRGKKQAHFERCLSMPGVRGLVYRYQDIDVGYMSLQGHPVERKFTGKPAQVLQHEIDHLDGILFTQTEGISIIDRNEFEQLIESPAGKMLL